MIWLDLAVRAKISLISPTKKEGPKTTWLINNESSLFHRLCIHVKCGDSMCIYIYNYSKLRCYSMSNSETYKYVAWPVCSHVYLKFFRCKSLSLVFSWLKLPRKALLPAINQPNENMSHQRGTDHQTWGPTCRNWPLINVIFPIPRIFFLRRVADFSKICKFALRIHWC